LFYCISAEFGIADEEVEEEFGEMDIVSGGKGEAGWL
jgi:hypothetical protein